MLCVFLKARKIMGDTGFDLRMWKTNLADLKTKIYDGIKKVFSVFWVEKKVLDLVLLAKQEKQLTSSFCD